MNLDRIEKKIEALLDSNKRWPVVVDFPNKRDLAKFIDHFKVGDNKFVSAGSFCGDDDNLRTEELINRIENNEGNTFLVHLTAYIKLQGKNSLQAFFKTILSMSVEGHVIIVLYQCRNFLKFVDKRFEDKGQIQIVEGEIDTSSACICFISPEVKGGFFNSYTGFNRLGEAYDSCTESLISVETKVKRDIFGMSLINTKQVNNSYDILCDKDIRIKNVPVTYGSQHQWNTLLNKIGKNDLDTFIMQQYGSLSQLELCINRFPEYTDENKWLYFILILIVGVEKNTYLYLVLNKVSVYTEVPKALYRTILDINYSDEKYLQMYTERKEILKNYGKYLNEASDYCKVLYAKQEEAIYYLTDLTQPERERIIEWLDQYGINYKTEQLKKVLDNVYPNLGSYLLDYRFKSELLNSYFYQYKYQKIINKVLPEFESIVNKQAIELGFVSELQPRTKLFDSLNLTNAQVYFIDALGVEYLGFIQKRCLDLGLSTHVLYGRCELPSLTCFNKDFLDVCSKANCTVLDIKDIDEIKHHGKDSFDYQKNKLPLYLTKELEIIDEVIKQIHASLLSSKYEKAVIVSDHGASRLAVLHETENLWQMETKGIHSGRCCPQNEINVKPHCAIEESGYWVLANYDRFKGSRKANVEVHGGASIEEVTVPIIEISIQNDSIEAFILEEFKCITLAAKEYPVLRIYVGMEGKNIIFRVNDKEYLATPTNEKYVYEVKLEDLTQKGKYIADILNENNVISSNNEFEIQKKGFKVVNLFA